MRPRPHCLWKDSFIMCPRSNRTTRQQPWALAYLLPPAPLGTAPPLNGNDGVYPASRATERGSFPIRDRSSYTGRPERNMGWLWLPPPPPQNDGAQSARPSHRPFPKRLDRNLSKTSRWAGDWWSWSWIGSDVDGTWAGYGWHRHRPINLHPIFPNPNNIVSGDKMTINNTFFLILLAAL
jgi:hypothetical protein